MPTRESTGYHPPKLKYKKTAYAQSPNTALPRQYMVVGALGPRGSGKTYGVCQLIKSFEQDPPVNEDGTRQAIRTIVISPTYDANECFRALKSVDESDIYRSYDEAKLREILESIEYEKDDTERYQKEMKAYRKFLKTKKVSDLSLKDDDLLALEMRDFEPPEEPKYPNGVSNFLVVDDMVGSAIYKQTGRNPFTTLLLRNRHVRTNLILCCQSLKSIPKTVRANVSCWILHKFGSRALIPELYEECASALVPEEQFEELYDDATAEPHQALVIDFSQPKPKIFSQSFHTVLKP